MPERLTRRAMLAALATTAGCTGLTGDDTPTDRQTPTATATATGTPRPATATETDTETATETETETETETATPEPVEERSWPEAYYQGPLVSAHEHMNGPDGFQMTQETMDWYVRWQQRNGLAQTMAITSEQYIPPVKAHDDRLVPFYFPWHQTHEHFDSLRTALERRLAEYPFYVGLGEFTLYDNPADDRPAIPANHPQLLKIYDLAAARDMPVMVHGADTSNGYDDPAKPVEHMEAALAHNRDCDFLVHATFQHGVTIDGETDVPVGEAVARLLERHPNLYYDISGQCSPYAYRYNESLADPYPAGKSTEAAAREWFTSKLHADGGVDYHAQRYYDRFEPFLEAHSERVLWGMDASWAWHYNDWVLDTWVDIARALLGKLSTEAARNVGYRTAETLFGIEVGTAD